MVGKRLSRRLSGGAKRQLVEYRHLREDSFNLIPRRGVFPLKETLRQKEKGRKSGFSEFSFEEGKWISKQRRLKTEEIGSFIEVSLRAAYCPMPVNLDVYDGLVCPYGCIYCYANYFRASLYTSFFDNPYEVGIRHCDPELYKRRLGPMLDKYLGEDYKGLQGIPKALAWRLPIRFGIRFEDFLKKEREKKVSLELLRFLAEYKYPVMINTKSDLLSEDEYLEALVDIGKSAVHITMITNDERLLKRLEPGAPSFRKRINSARVLSEAGVRVVARIEPYMIGVTDTQIEDYIAELKEAGIKHITLDSYSYSARGPSIYQAFQKRGIDLDRIYLLNSDSQPLSSYWLGKFMELLREAGFSCSTFDMGNVPHNSQGVCCEVEDFFDCSVFNWGCTVGAIRFLVQNRGKSCGWGDFERWVEEKSGGFLSEELRSKVLRSWNGEDAYGPGWAYGVEPVGWDEWGAVWRYEGGDDFRERIKKGAML